jgi:hypothetical protein
MRLRQRFPMRLITLSATVPKFRSWPAPFVVTIVMCILILSYEGSLLLIALFRAGTVRGGTAYVPGHPRAALAPSMGALRREGSLRPPLYRPHAWCQGGDFYY